MTGLLRSWFQRLRKWRIHRRWQRADLRRRRQERNIAARDLLSWERRRREGGNVTLPDRRRSDYGE